MKPIKQTVYLPVKVDDELPESGGWVICDNAEELLFSHNYGWMYNANVVVPKEKQPKFWLKQQEGYFFTPEQLNEYTKSVIKQSVETAAERSRLSKNGSNTPYGEHFSGKCGSWTVNKESITNTFEETFKQFEV